jgi:hypothetical protein
MSEEYGTESFKGDETIATESNDSSESAIAEADLDAAPVADGFAIHDEATANWLVRRIVELRSYRARVMAWAAGEVRRSEQRERFFLEQYGNQLERWAIQAIEESHQRRKSISLPAGVVGFRREPQRLIVNDENALRAWCRRNLPEAVKVSVMAVGREANALEEWRRKHCPSSRSSQDILKSMVASHIGTTGEIPDGAEIGGGASKLFIR